MILWNSFFFLLLAAIACVFAVAVVVSNNIVRMACYLIVSLAAVAGLFFTAGADFLGAAQIMVYVGGTMVLLVFGVMLTARGPFVSMKTGGGQWILAIIVGGALLAVLLQAAFSIPGWAEPSRDVDDAEALASRDAKSGAERLGLGLMGVRTDRLSEKDPVRSGGMSGYLLPFEIISIHLVVVLVGAAYLARARRRVIPRPAIVRGDGETGPAEFRVTGV
ncbi:MAG: NADH-quinone oxidoreductase subunit J [Thermoguttaceae bacterium]